MADLKTKFSIGDVVFRAGTTTVKKRHKCPDCLDTHKWKAISPSGGEYQFACPRCGASYMGDRDLSLEYHEFGPSVMKLTVGSVRIDTHDQRPVSYMCIETGVGSGSVYYEPDLFPTHDEAMVAAEAKAAADNIQVPWVGEQYKKSVRVCDYQLESASLKLAKDQKISHSVQLQGLFDDLRSCETPDEIREVLEKFEFKAAA